MDDDTEQSLVRDGEELTGTEISRGVQPAVTSSRYEDPLRYDTSVGSRTLVFGGLDRRPFSRIPGGFGFFSDSHVRHFLSKPSTCRRTITTMVPVLRCWDVRVARCHFWACGRNFPSLSATSRRERTRSLEQMFWVQYYHIPWTLGMAYCLRRGRFSPASPEGFSSIWPSFYSGPLLHTTILRGCATLLRPYYWRPCTSVQWPTRGVDVVRRRYRPYCG